MLILGIMSAGFGDSPDVPHPPALQCLCQLVFSLCFVCLSWALCARMMLGPSSNMDLEQQLSSCTEYEESSMK